MSSILNTCLIFTKYRFIFLENLSVAPFPISTKSPFTQILFFFIFNFFSFIFINWEQDKGAPLTTTIQHSFESSGHTDFKEIHKADQWDKK